MEICMPHSPKEPFLPVIRSLARTFQAFEQFSAHHIRQMDLTPPQFDVIATLGNTQGMSCKELSQKTLITKGTLTGVVDRLAEKGLVQRTPLENDRRSVFISLTLAGDALFAQAFPAHLHYMKAAFERFSAVQLDAMTTELNRLGQAFTHALEQQHA
jgi:MarR family 2-MHQ and catechol resistance regulon transcriptional repressor